jgi:hypothetical protein
MMVAIGSTFVLTWMGVQGIVLITKLEKQENMPKYRIRTCM